MEKVELSQVECSSSTSKVNSHNHYQTSSATKSSHKSQHSRNSSNNNNQDNSYGNGRQNQVSNVLLFGIPIVALVMDGKERLCLAQISSTLLKEFSYNEIHNRRVALGINCIQCTPVQLEILRRAGAMPVTSRRCGMITKREAERLCQSFLGDHAPPQLPENFAFDVYHECAWGCRGSFVPSRYNSSRAKCIRCTYCQLFFSPNKFIFHSHRLPTSRYIQPDAANFNSWRRHLKLFNVVSTIPPAISNNPHSTTNNNPSTTTLTILGGRNNVSGNSSGSDSSCGSSTSNDHNLSNNNVITTTTHAENNLISSSSGGIIQPNPLPCPNSSLASTPEIVHAWEDVKAMFNGGTRKRLLAVHSIPTSSSSPSRPHHQSQEKSQNPSGGGRKGMSGGHSKRGNANTNSGNSSVRGNSSGGVSTLELQQQARQSHFLQQHSSIPINISQHQFTSSQISSSTHHYHHNIWNPGISSPSRIMGENDAMNNSISSRINSSASNAFNDIITAAAAAAAAVAASTGSNPLSPSSASSSLVLQQQLPLHPTPFPWFHRHVASTAQATPPPLPPLFPFSHPFGPTCKYLNNIESEINNSLGSGKNSSNSSAFKPIMPASVGESAGMIGHTSLTLAASTGSIEYPFLSSSSSTSSWLNSSGFSTRHNINGTTRTNDGIGLPEDLSLNSIPSSSAGSSASSSSSPCSASSIEYKVNNNNDLSKLHSANVQTPGPITIKTKQENISPPIDVIKTTGSNKRLLSTCKKQEPQHQPFVSSYNSDEESTSDVDITDTEEDETTLWQAQLSQPSEAKKKCDGLDRQVVSLNSRYGVS